MLKHVENGTNIVKHGKTYTKEDALQYSYPFSLCPECLSQDTKIVPDINTDFAVTPYDLRSTGDYHYVKRGIFLIKETFVNYKCNSCGCKFCERFIDDRDGKFFTRILYRKVPYFVIALSIFLISLFSMICSIIVMHECKLSGIEQSGFIKMWFILSIVLFFGDTLIAPMDLID